MLFVAYWHTGRRSRRFLTVPGLPKHTGPRILMTTYSCFRYYYNLKNVYKTSNLNLAVSQHDFDYYKLINKNHLFTLTYLITLENQTIL